MDFIAKKDNKTEYYQVTYQLDGINKEETIEREFGAYKYIDDNYPKYVISLDNFDYSKDGIIHLNLLNFLLDEQK